MNTTIKHITADADQYGQLVSVVSELLSQAREQVVSHIHTTMVQTYWQIGGVFSHRNLEQMRKFYVLFGNPQTVSAK